MSVDPLCRYGRFAAFFAGAALALGVRLPGAEPAAAPSRDFRHSLHYEGGILYGRLLSADPATGLLWESLGVPARTIPLETVREVRFAAPRAALTEAADGTRIGLVHGDVLHGRLLAMDAGGLSLETAYAGTLQIRRSCVRFLLPAAALSSRVYVGPDLLDHWGGWNSLPPRWHWKDGVLTAGRQNARAWRDVGLGRSAQIELVLAWPMSAGIDMDILLYTNPEWGLRGELYRLRLQGTHATLWRQFAAGSQLLGKVYVPILAQTRRAHFSILVSLANRVLELAVNGMPAGKWRDPSPFAGSGTALAFVTRKVHPIAISRMRVAPWPDLGADDGAGAGPERDTVRLANDDGAEGAIRAIEHGMVGIQTEYGPLRIPLERVAWILFAGAENKRPARGRRRVRAWVRGGGRVTMEWGRIENGRLQGRSRALGDATIRLDALARLEFLPAPRMPAGGRKR